MNENIGRKIKQLRESLGLTQEEFGDRIGLSSGTISGIEKGQRGSKKGVGIETLKKIATTYNVSLDWLALGEKQRHELPVITEPTEKRTGMKLQAIPVINEVPGGYPAYPDVGDHIRAYVYLPKMPKDAFGLFVIGDSMKPDINEGDIVIVDPRIRKINRGDLGVFRMNGWAAVKYYVPIEGGYILESANSKYSPIVVTGDIECELIGKVIYKIIKC